MNRKIVIGIILTGIAFIAGLLLTPAVYAQVGIPNVNLSIGGANTGPQEVSQGLQILILLTVIALAPSILVMVTAFTRIIIVLSLLRQAVGTPQLPPNQILISIALILTFFVMAPTFDKVNNTAVQPYLKGQMSQEVAFKTGMTHLRLFMYKQTDEADLQLFVKLSKIERPKVLEDVPTYVLIPAFTISELKTAFKMGFIVFLPFLIIDIVVASILVAMGMLFLPPVTVSLPFKIILFVVVDGWGLVCEALVAGFVT